MLIACPSCASEYQIPTERVGMDGRSVRCAACRETWFITPEDVSAALEAEMTEAMMAAVGPGAAENRAGAQAALDAWESALAQEGPENAPGAEPSGERAEAEAGRTGSPKRFGRLAPIALGIGVTAFLALALIGRTPLVRLVPQSAGLYARIGLPVNLRGLELRDVAAFQTPGEGGQLVVEGNLVGITAAGVAVPPIEVEVRDAQNQSLYRWSIAPPRPTLENRETARFRASLSAPPVQGRSVEVRFASDVRVPETTASTAKVAPETKVAPEPKANPETR